ncbi:MAG: DinB family protein [Bacteroidota bacterium]
MQVQAISSEECQSYYKRYLDKLSPDTTLIGGFESGKAKVIQFFEAIPDEKLHYRYADGKWSIKEVLQHLIDTERVFSYRAFRIGRRDTTALVSFDHNAYVPLSGADEKSRAALLNEFEATRNASIALLKSLSAEDLMSIGTTSGYSVSARAVAFMIIGHDIWHMNIIEERYL